MAVVWLILRTLSLVIFAPICFCDAEQHAIVKIAAEGKLVFDRPTRAIVGLLTLHSGLSADHFSIVQLRCDQTNVDEEQQLYREGVDCKFV